MQIMLKFFLVILASVLVPCIADENSHLLEVELERQLQVFENALNSPAEFRERLKKDCPHFNSILLTTAETIQLGTRVFNAGGAGLTVRIYEGTTYKILYIIKDDCMELSDALQAGIYKAENEKGFADKAWAFRNTLDLIMGGPPTHPPGGA